MCAAASGFGGAIGVSKKLQRGFTEAAPFIIEAKNLQKAWREEFMQMGAPAREEFDSQMGSFANLLAEGKPAFEYPEFEDSKAYKMAGELADRGLTLLSRQIPAQQAVGGNLYTPGTERELKESYTALSNNLANEAYYNQYAPERRAERESKTNEWLQTKVAPQLSFMNTLSGYGLGTTALAANAGNQATDALTNLGALAWNKNAGSASALQAGINSNLAFGSQMAGGGMMAMSSRMLKYKIKELDSVNANDIINSLSPVTFFWKDTDTADAGFIAEEVKEILPEAVRDYNGNLMINFTPLVAVLVKSVQELKQEVELLKKKGDSDAVLSMDA
jgi:hypothetical protein